MGRTIRMSAADALARGLIDPELAALASPPVKRSPKSRKAKSKSSVAGLEDPTLKSEKPKRRRSVSRPAVHPKMSAGPAGSGHVERASDGSVRAVELMLDLIPVPKERPRVVTNPKTDKVFGYTPARTKYFTTEVRRVVESVLAGQAPIDGPVRLDMTFAIQLPKSWPKWKKAAALHGVVAPTGRPDMDNLEKALLDAFNECLIQDDALVVERRASKVYDEVPHIRVRVERTRQASLNASRSEIEALLSDRASTC